MFELPASLAQLGREALHPCSQSVTGGALLNPISRPSLLVTSLPLLLLSQETLPHM